MNYTRNILFAVYGSEEGCCAPCNAVVVTCYPDDTKVRRGREIFYYKKYGNYEKDLEKQ